MNKYTTLFALLLSALLSFPALAQDRFAIVTDNDFLSLASHATRRTNLSNINIETTSSNYSYCEDSNPNTIFLTGSRLSNKDLRRCIKRGVNGLIEYTVGRTSDGNQSVYAYRKIVSDNESSKVNQWLTALGEVAQSRQKLGQFGLAGSTSDDDDCPKPKCPKTGSCTKIIRMSAKCCPKTGTCN